MKKSPSTLAVFLAAFAFFAAGLFTGVEQAHAHARLVTPAPRSTDSSNEAAPCGPYARMSPIPYQAGSKITVNWVETIHHSGSFQIYFSPANDANLGTGVAAGATKLLDVPQQFADSNVPHNYSAQITLPNVICSGCTIQLVQTATDISPADPFFYFSCADIALSATAPSPTPSPTPSPSPQPTPVAGCAPAAPAATFTAVNSQIIQPMCLQCHSGTNPQGGYSFSSYAGVSAAVNTASPSSSAIYQVTIDGAMPQQAAPLSASQEDLLLRWIQSGAPNN